MHCGVGSHLSTVSSSGCSCLTHAHCSVIPRNLAETLSNSLGDKSRSRKHRASAIGPDKALLPLVLSVLVASSSSLTISVDWYQLVQQRFLLDSFLPVRKRSAKRCRVKASVSAFREGLIAGVLWSEVMTVYRKSMSSACCSKAFLSFLCFRTLYQSKICRIWAFT